MTEDVVAVKEGGGGGMGFHLFVVWVFFSLVVLHSIRFFPISSAPTVLTANVKVNSCLGTGLQIIQLQCCCFLTSLSTLDSALDAKAEHPAAFLGAMLPSVLGERQDAAPTSARLSTRLIASRCNQSKTAT